MSFSCTLVLYEESQNFAKMKFFQLVQKFYQTMGIYPSSPRRQRNRPPFNLRNLFFSLSLLIFFVLSTGYFLLEAQSIIEMSQSFYVAIAELTCLIHFSITFWKIIKMIELIDTIDKFIEKSSLKFTKKIFLLR